MPPFHSVSLSSAIALATTSSADVAVPSGPDTGLTALCTSRLVLAGSAGVALLIGPGPPEEVGGAIRGIDCGHVLLRALAAGLLATPTKVGPWGGV